MRRLLLLVASLAVVASACGTIETPAASVGDVDISQDSIRDELDDIGRNASYRAALEDSYGPLRGAGTGTWAGNFVAQVLSVRVYFELLGQELGRQGLEVTDQDRAEATAAVEQQLGSLDEEAREAFSQRQRDRLVQQQALVAAVSRSVEGDPQAFFDANPGLFSEACLYHILVADESEAADLKRQIDAGADFSALAREHSTDTGSAASGGDLGCAPLSRYVEEFAEAAAAAPIGQVIGPVESDFGYHLIRVVNRTPRSFEEARQEVSDRVLQEQSAALDELLVQVTCGEDVDVSVDPQYGRWDRSACDADGGLARVNPRTSTGGR
jgi:parvulin-like peptidyl-prolyl isomerase